MAKEIVGFLLHAGADPNMDGYDSFGYSTVLQCAAHQDDVEMGQLLIANGANIDGRAGKHGSALQVAIQRKSRNFVNMLLDKGADVNQPASKHGGTLQIAACPRDYQPMEDVMGRLLDLNVDVNIGDKKSGSALQAAVFRCSESMIRKLLKKGPKVNAVGGAEGSVLHAARHRVEILRLLLNHGADINVVGINKYATTYNEKARGTIIQTAAFERDIDTVEELLDRGARVVRQEKEWGGVLAGAAGNSKEWPRWMDVVRRLLKNGVPIDDESAPSGTALQKAASRGDLAMVKLLLQAGANINSRPGRGGTALQQAARSGVPEVVQILLDGGARPQLSRQIYHSVGSERLSAIALDTVKRRS